MTDRNRDWARELPESLADHCHEVAEQGLPFRLTVTGRPGKGHVSVTVESVFKGVDSAQKKRSMFFEECSPEQVSNAVPVLLNRALPGVW